MGGARTAILATFVLINFVGFAAGTAEADQVSDAEMATLANAEDITSAETAYLGHLAGDGSVKCATLLKEGLGTPDAGTRARDLAEWGVHCESSDSPPPRYDLLMQVSFEYFTGGSFPPPSPGSYDWLRIPETEITCQAPSADGRAIYPHCANAYTYPAGHASLEHFHRARFCLVAPVALPCSYSSHWFAGSAPNPIPAESDLSISIEGPEQILVGQTAQYTLTIESGSASSEAVDLADVFLGGGSLNALPSQGSCELTPQPGETGSKIVNCSLGSLAAGELATVVVSARPGQEGPYPQAAAIVRAGPDADDSDNHAEFVTTVQRGPQPDKGPSQA